jgi:branched-chain amino acid transport system substrate-binding protein
LSGVDSAAGLPGKVAEQMAISDINVYLQSAGSPVRFTSVIDDAASDPSTALQNFQTLVSQGIQVCICGDTSGEASNILSYATAHHVVDLAISSSPALSVPDRGYLFRFIPDDSHAGPAQAALMIHQGAEAVIIVYRNDPFGTGLANSTEVAFKAMGGTVVDQIGYSPVSSGSYDFTSQLSQLNTDYQNAVSQYGASAVAIDTIGFAEASVMLQQAQSLYPNLLTNPWYGSNGISGDSSVITGSGSLEAQAKLLSVAWTPENSTKYVSFVQRLESLTGGTFNIYASGIYDETWVAALSILACGANDGTCVFNMIPKVAYNYYGVGGWWLLNSFGDAAGGDFGIWEIANVSGTVQWIQIGVYSSATGTLTFTRQP